MTQTRQQKAEVLEQLKGLLTEQKPLILVDYRGLKGRDISLLRKDLQAASSKFQVIKTSLFKKALKGTKLSLGEDIVKRPLALVYNSEPIGLSKLIYQFSQFHPALEIVGGILEGKYSSTDQIKELALLPSKEELQARLVQILKLSLLRPQLIFSNLQTRLILALKNKLS